MAGMRAEIERMQPNLKSVEQFASAQVRTRNVICSTTCIKLLLCIGVLLAHTATSAVLLVCVRLSYTSSTCHKVAVRSAFRTCWCLVYAAVRSSRDVR
jgi:hypothetical protein